MEKFKFIIVLIASSISLIISIITLCSFEDYNYDKISMLMSGFSVIVSALAVLSAILIGWQIYNIINIKKLREDTLRNYDNVIIHSNRNLLFTVGSLAEFYTVQYLDTNIEEEPEKATTLLFGALLNKTLAMDLSVELNEMNVFNSAISTSNIILEDKVPLSEEQKTTLLNILSKIPDSWKTKEFLYLYDNLAAN